MKQRKIGTNLVDEETGEILARSTSPEADEVVPVARAYQAAPFFKTPWNHNRDEESERCATPTVGTSLTKQEFKEDADINVILNRFLKGGEPPPAALPEHFLDLTGRRTYKEMQEQITEATSQFYSLPPSLRYQHQNSPERWADEVVAAANRGDRAKLRELGLDAPEPTETPAEPPKGGTPAPTAETTGKPS